MQMRDLKVLHVGKYYSPYAGGIETQLKNLLGQLRTHMDVEVVVAQHDSSTGWENVDGVRVLRLPTVVTLASTPFCPSLPRQISKSKADIVHLHLPNPAAVLALSLSRYKGPVIVSHHSDIIRQRVLRRLIEPLQHWIMRRSAVVCVASPEYLESSEELTHHRSKCQVLPYGIPVRDLTPAQRNESEGIRRRYKRPLVLSVGRMVYYKGFEYLIRSMTSIDADLLLVGEGPMRSELEGLSRDLQVADRVHFLGEVPDVEPYYEACDLFVLASVARSEAFGMVQLEAMLREKPVVNTRLGTGVNFVSPDGVTGLTVPPADPDALAEAVNRLLNDQDLRRSMGRAARTRVISEFSDVRMATKMLELYRSVLEGEMAVTRHDSAEASVAVAR
jgi:rhamnosyl/mannosyltransferase